MTIFISTLSQLAFLFAFIALGYFLRRGKFLPDNSATVLSKLENTVFIPALVIGTLVENFTFDRISAATDLLLTSFIVAAVVVPLSIIIPRFITRDKHTQNIYTYGLTFSNFAFMGNAVVASLFPEMLFEYIIFTIPLWVLIYLWGVPCLLLYDPKQKAGVKGRIKAFINPMFISMIVGMILGMTLSLTELSLPSWLMGAINSAAGCMSPVAMLLTGMVAATIPVKKIFDNVGNYIISAVRLIGLPLLFIIAANFFELSTTAYVCILCSLSMPLGLNTIIIPSSQGLDTTVATGMTVISHIISCLTIPLIFAISGV